MFKLCLMIQIEDLRLAAALLKQPSLSAAARSLNVTPPALSMRLRKLEANLGLALASRTAQRLTLTAEGESFGREANALLGRIDAMRESLHLHDKRLTGTLRISAPFGYGRARIAPLLALFAQLHPGLKVELDLRETPWPDRHDADVVIHIGAVKDSSWVARTLQVNERWLCASPAYLRANGVPQTPRDLAGHACICIRENDEDATLWHMRPSANLAARRSEAVRIQPAFVSNDGTVARHGAEQGLGLVLRSSGDAEEAVSQGKLVRVLCEWEFDSAPVLILVPTRKGKSARVAALLSFIEEKKELSFAR